MKAVNGFMISNFEYKLYKKRNLDPQNIFIPKIGEKVIIKSNSELKKEFDDAGFFFCEKYDAFIEVEKEVKIINKVYNNPTDWMLYIFYLNNKKYKLGREYFKLRS